MPFAGTAGEADAGVGDEQPVDHHVIRARSTHAKRLPGVEHFYLRRLHRYREMDDRVGLALGVQHRARHQHIAGGSRRSEHLARGDLVAAFDLLGLAGAADPVGAAAGQEDDAVRWRRASATARRRPPSGGASARPEWRPDGCAWQTPARSSCRNGARMRSMSASSATSAPHRRVRAARRPRRGRPLSAPRSSRKRSGRPRPPPRPWWRTLRRARGQSPRYPRRTSAIATFGTDERSAWFVIVGPPTIGLAMPQVSPPTAGLSSTGTVPAIFAVAPAGMQLASMPISLRRVPWPRIPESLGIERLCRVL